MHTYTYVCIYIYIYIHIPPRKKHPDVVGDHEAAQEEFRHIVEAPLLLIAITNSYY